AARRPGEAIEPGQPRGHYHAGRVDLCRRRRGLGADQPYPAADRPAKGQGTGIHASERRQPAPTAADSTAASSETEDVTAARGVFLLANPAAHASNDPAGAARNNQPINPTERTIMLTGRQWCTAVAALCLAAAPLAAQEKFSKLVGNVTVGDVKKS